MQKPTDLNCTRLSEKRKKKSQKVTYCMIQLLKCSHREKNITEMNPGLRRDP